MQLRWEMHNIFNRANFDDTDGNLTYGVVQVNLTGGLYRSGAIPCTGGRSADQKLFRYADYIS